MRDCREERVAEAVVSLNALATNSCGTMSVSLPQQRQAPTATQTAVLKKLGECVAKFPGPVHESSDEALFALLKSRDMYDLDGHTREDFEFEKVGVLSETTSPQPLLDHLGPTRAIDM